MKEEDLHRAKCPANISDRGTADGGWRRGRMKGKGRSKRREEAARG